MIKILEKEEDFELLTKEKILVDFYADWCGPCKMIANDLHELENEINILKVNVDNYTNLAIKYGINAIPALYIFENNEVKNKSIGYIEKNQIKDLYQ